MLPINIWGQDIIKNWSNIGQNPSRRKSLNVVPIRPNCINWSTNSLVGPKLIRFQGDDNVLSEDFASFFLNKIFTIRTHLLDYPKFDSTQYSCPNHFSCFTVAGQHEIREIIMRSKYTTCPSDPIPSSLVKQHLKTLLPAFVHFINLSLQAGSFPPVGKRTHVTPLLKKHLLTQSLEIIVQLTTFV